MSEDVNTQLMLKTLERIERGVGKLDEDIDDIKKRLASGDTEMKLTRQRLERVEQEQECLRKRLDDAQQEEQRQTVEFERRRSGRVWDIFKIAAAMALTAAGTLLWSGAKTEAARAAQTHREAIGGQP